MSTDDHQAAIKAIVDAAPPLSDDKLAALLANADMHPGRVDVESYFDEIALTCGNGT